MEEYKEAFMTALLNQEEADDNNNNNNNGNNPSSATTTTITTTTSVPPPPKIYAGYLNLRSKRDGTFPRKNFGRPEFDAILSQHDYVLSPDGDRPECYRHYEALGLGTVPLTQLDRNVHRHFIGTGLIFNNTIWSVQELLLLESQQLSTNPIVNRNAALEEYWMDYVDWVVQRHLTWYDTSKQEPTTMDRLFTNFTF
jgi:hypothetical protein